MTENAVKAEIGDEPYQIATQRKLFKAGMLGSAVTIWSAYPGEGGHAPQMLMINEEPVIVRIDEDDVDDQLLFAGGYICGYVESVGGDLNKLEIWLEPYPGLPGQGTNSS